MPTRRGLGCCWARLAMGHPTAALPRSAMNSRRLTRPPISTADTRVLDVARQPALKQLLHREVPGRAMSGLGHGTKLMACQASIVGLLLLHQRTCRPWRSAGKKCAKSGLSSRSKVFPQNCLLDQLMGAGEQRRWHVEIERL